MIELPANFYASFKNAKNVVATQEAGVTPANCFAWAAGDDARIWDPKSAYWPPGARREQTFPGVMDAFKVIGYVWCAHAKLEVEFEKVALYNKIYGGNTPNEVCHAARQLESGRWTSKLGPWGPVVEHDLSDLEGEEYGFPSYILARPRLDR